MLLGVGTVEGHNIYIMPKSKRGNQTGAVTEGAVSQFRRQGCWIHQREKWKQASGLRASGRRRKTKFYPGTGQFHNSFS